MRPWLIAAFSLLLFSAAASGQMTSAECLDCHGDASLTKEVGGRQVSMHVNKARYDGSVHAPMECTDCHSDISEYPHEPAPQPVDCSGCHSDSVEAWQRSIHAESLQKRNPRAANCQSCHGNAHEIISSSDPASRTSRANQPKMCGSCHGIQMVMAPSGLHVEPFLNYQESVHGRAAAGGNQQAAVCSDCHKVHDVLTARPADSPINRFNIAETCGHCHKAEAEQFIRSVHGVALERGNSQTPTCTNCHGIHMIRAHDDPRSTVSAAAVATTTCSQCHESVRLNQELGVAQTVRSYRESYHGLAARFGSNRVANCASCHGVHNILPSSNPQSTIHPSNLEKTCGACHPGAGANFARGSVHLNVPESQDPGTIGTRIVRLLYLPIIIGTIGFMLLHNVLSWRRQAVAKRNQPGRVIIRMNRNQRIQHMINFLAFFVLVITGFALAWPESWLAVALGANEEVRRWGHRIAAIVMMAVGLYHVGYMVSTTEGRKGLRDFWFKWRDLTDLKQNFLYFLGKAPHRPKFERFTYGEKMEYWALVWGTAVMAVTGLILWFSVEVSRFMPRWVVDIAGAIHWYEAILATLAIVVWHFYGVIFDPAVYPMNWSWWDGRMSVEEYEHEHGADYETWRRAQIDAGDHPPEPPRHG
jgi:cytochrome b subunit of formate dehydrogenase